MQLDERTAEPKAEFRVDVLVAGLGPGGCAAALATHRHGLTTLAVEARGTESTRERLVLVRPGAQAALERLGLPGFTEGRRTTTIRQTEARLRAELAARAAAGGPGASALALRWHTRIVHLAAGDDAVHVVLEDADGRRQSLHAGHVIDATGGRLESAGLPARRRHGPSHVVVTNEFDTEPWFDGIAGVRDPGSGEALILVPMRGRQSITAYLDLPPGRAVDAPAAVQRFEAIAARLGLRRARQPAHVVDVVQRLQAAPGRGRVVPIGDSVGTVDLWLGAGMSAAIEDAVDAGEAIAAAHGAPGPAAVAHIAAAQAVIHARHRRRSRQGRLMQAARPLLVRLWPAQALDRVERDSVRSPRGLWQAMRVVAGRRPADRTPPA
jgi:2-polyprenyl-6-methoxyphenol hydroxylase-like FAD-dependent oxidoreductase